MKVAIVGGATRTGAQVLSYPLKKYGGDWEIWGLNAIRPRWADRLGWTRWFNLHRWKHLKRDWAPGLRAEIAWAQAFPKVPFYVLDPWRKGALPNQVIFPKDKLLAMPRGDYHAGSFDWLVAYAVLLGANHIALHGVGLALDSLRDEPYSARACLEYWCGYAQGKGVLVTAAEDCELMAQYHLVKSNSLYGYDDVQLVERRT